MPRKTTGCWTCRARKKKCDDGRPVCAACTMRTITCYGYDAKPAWMDGGEQERSMLLIMKARAKESYSQRRRSRAMRSVHNARGARDGSSSTMAATTATTSPAGLQGEYSDSPTTTAAAAAAAAAATTIAHQPHDDQDSKMQMEPTEACHRQNNHQRHPSYQGQMPLAHASYTSHNQQQTLHTSHPHASSETQQPYNPCHYQDPPAQTTAESSRNAGTASDFPYSETELSLLMYYFDHVFPRLCPFFTYSAGDKGRGWLLSLFLRTRPLCAAAICISACDQAQFVLGPLSDIPQPRHDLEMKHIQIVVDLRAHLAQLSQQSGPRRMAVAVEALACMMHLIMFELWIPRHGEANDWVVHLDAAAALLSSVDTTMANCNGGHGSSSASLDSPMSLSMAMSTPSDHTSPSASTCQDATIQDYFPVEFLTDCEASAFDFFLGQYTACFIISAVGHELTPNSTESIRRTHAIFHRNQSRLRDMFGLDDWVMTTMLDVAVLKAWKQRERSAGTLSLRELTRRADVLEARISEGLARMATSSTAESLKELATGHEANPWRGGPRLARPTRDEISHMVTSIYLNATLLLLHVVVSGFYPNLPEIRRAVLHTLKALEYMRGHCETSNIPSWPFCVAGCLALESEYPRFRALSPAPRAGHHPLVLTMWTLSIIERCWQMRAAQPNKMDETVDWVTAMNDLGTRLLLL
ncbi:hypothetical protein SBRCBS47491_001347 [Sporothrix bragantina]|uniref:Zn(2)-C6 fungal-type domain-containing protein n=1 Tax=Sporothrix bragantina TaxID=671064 RepID=A0ABP0AYC4_9PEZI